MKRTNQLKALLVAALTAWSCAPEASAKILSITDASSDPGAQFNLTAGSGRISTPDGNTTLFWGLADASAGTPVQYPAPTLEVNEGDVVTITLTNSLSALPASVSVPVSLIFPGQGPVIAAEVLAPTQLGLLADKEALPGGAVSYTFTASHPGTYVYQSGTQPDLQVEMGLVGALIVRPAGFDATVPANRRAYGHADSMYDREYLFLTTEVDPRIHRLVETGKLAEVDSNNFFPVYWLLNGRGAPDTLQVAGAAWLPNQPYNCLPQMHPTERVLLRLVGGGRDYHPFHTHGQHMLTLARNGRLLSTAPASAGADLAHKVFTTQLAPGQTVDGLFTWDGARLGWDIYGHAEGDPLVPGEFAPDHGKPVPVLLPETLDLTLGGFWTGSPFLGQLLALPPGQGGLNPNGAYTFMWHSHTEKELCNNDIFPGGLMTMLVVEAPWIEITE